MFQYVIVNITKINIQCTLPVFSTLLDLFIYPKDIKTLSKAIFLYFTLDSLFFALTWPGTSDTCVPGSCVCHGGEIQCLYPVHHNTKGLPLLFFVISITGKVPLQHVGGLGHFQVTHVSQKPPSRQVLYCECGRSATSWCKQSGLLFNYSGTSKTPPTLP